jgi:hypothetical protein
MIDFRGLLSCLNAAEVRFILVGGMAAIAHGATRLTQDVDIVYARDNENLRRLAEALRPYNPYLRGAPPNLPFLWDDGTLLRGLNFTLTTKLGDIDLLGEIAGGGNFDELKPHVIVLEVFGMRCLCLSLTKLIEVKRAAGRPKDLETVAELEIIAQLSGDPNASGD